MKPPAYTTDEKRLAALRSYDVVGTPAEPGFDDIVALAAQICETPVALVSLVDSDRQWFKAHFGFEGCETDLESSVCVHALVEHDLLIIPDLSKDERTRRNPLVANAPHIRFYAGAPLRTASGEALGTLCVIDVSPRPAGLTEAQAGGLRNLARQVMSQLELRKAIVDRDEAIRRERRSDTRREDSQRQYRSLFGAIDDGFCIVEVKFEGGRAVDYRFVEVNPAFARQTGLDDAQGKWMRALAPNHEQHWFDTYGRVATTGEPVRFEHFAEALGGRWFDVHAFRVGDPADHRVGILFNDATNRKTAEAFRREAEAAQIIRNQELSHRMKNMFAMVQAIATQTLRGVSDKEAVEGFTQRLHALSTAHDVLLLQNEDRARIGDVIRGVAGAVADPARLAVEGPELSLGPRAALSVSLLIHELATNAVKYGALSNAGGSVRVAWSLAEVVEERELVLDWRERDGPPVATPYKMGFGSKLIKMGLAGTGGAVLHYLPSGLHAEFRAPLAQVQSA